MSAKSPDGLLAAAVDNAPAAQVDATQQTPDTVLDAPPESPATQAARAELLAALRLRSASVSANALTAVVASDTISRQLRDETDPAKRLELFSIVRWSHVEILLIQDADSWGRPLEEAVGIADEAVEELREEVELVGLDPEASLFGRLVQIARHRAAARESHDPDGKLWSRVDGVPRNR